MSISCPDIVAKAQQAQHNASREAYRRELVARLAAAHLSNPSAPGIGNEKGFARDLVCVADAIIAELDEEKK